MKDRDNSYADCTTDVINVPKPEDKEAVLLAPALTEYIPNPTPIVTKEHLEEEPELTMVERRVLRISKLQK